MINDKLFRKFIKTLDDKDPNVRISAIRALSNFKQRIDDYLIRKIIRNKTK